MGAIFELSRDSIAAACLVLMMAYLFAVGWMKRFTKLPLLGALLATFIELFLRILLTVRTGHGASVVPITVAPFITLAESFLNICAYLGLVFSMLTLFFRNITVTAPPPVWFSISEWAWRQKRYWRQVGGAFLAWCSLILVAILKLVALFLHAPTVKADLDLVSRSIAFLLIATCNIAAWSVVWPVEALRRATIYSLVLFALSLIHTILLIALAIYHRYTGPIVGVNGPVEVVLVTITLGLQILEYLLLVISQYHLLLDELHATILHSIRRSDPFRPMTVAAALFVARNNA